MSIFCRILSGTISLNDHDKNSQTTIKCREMAEELTELRKTAGLISSIGVWLAAKFVVICMSTWALHFLYLDGSGVFREVPKFNCIDSVCDVESST
ncbi:unnamed protein product [Cylicocyclus nassatus]|uniref:Uncharacterized protein n=1 Tax=Cylicocyclus nassatus TaxID=53992 RepID=A0AA36GER6_CYLNA|nr:unnamed protein product [Cylicocyclus nassatus]